MSLIITVNIFNNWYVAVHCVLTLIQLCSLTERNAVQIINCE